MGWVNDAADIQARVNRSPMAIVLILLVLGFMLYRFHWSDDPLREGADKAVRNDPAVVQKMGQIRRINLKTTVRPACSLPCATYLFDVVGTLAIMRVEVESRKPPNGQIDLRVHPK